MPLVQPNHHCHQVALELQRFIQLNFIKTPLCQGFSLLELLSASSKQWTFKSQTCELPSLHVPFPPPALMSVKEPPVNWPVMFWEALKAWQSPLLRPLAAMHSQQ